MIARFFSTSIFFLKILQSLKWAERHGWLAVLLWLALTVPTLAIELRVAIEEGVNKIKVGSSTNAVVRNGAGKILGELAGLNGFSAELRGGQIAISKWQASQIWLEPKGDGFIFIGDRWYRGRALLIPTGKGITAVNFVDLEQYLYSVLGAEMAGDWPQEALKAQAVAARTYALYERQKSGNRIYDLGDSQGWQVYKGVATESPGTYAAVNATAGEVLTYNGQIILAAFHSASGGHTENVEDVWMEALPYLRGVPDYDMGTPGYQWRKTFSNNELSRRISGVGRIISMTPERTTPRGSIISMKVVGDAGTRIISGNDLRNALGLRSTRFRVFPQGVQAGSKGAAKIPSSFIIDGYGFGHAVGMSQWGAYKLAQHGIPYTSILAHYYRGASLAKIKY